MSKYNHMASIPIESLTKEELDQAMKEWSHYDLHMEKLLRACMDKGIVTNGCHPEINPYIGFILGKNIESEKKLVNGIFDVKNTQLLIMPDGGNPFSGPDWDKAGVCISAFIDNKKDVDDFFDKLTASLDKEPTNENFYFKTLELADFLKDKESRLSIRVLHDENDEYLFEIETRALSENMYIFYKEFLTKSGLTFNGETPDHRLRYAIKNMDTNIMNQEVEKLIDYVKNNLNIPNFDIEDEYSYNMIARKKKREFGETAEGLKKFKQWLEEEHEKLVSSWNEKGK